MWRVAASRGSKNGCPWGCVGGGRRPSAHEGELGEYKWAWQAAGLEPWALQDTGSEIWPRGSGHVWLPARAFTCAGDCLVWNVHFGVSLSQPQGAAQWGCSCVCVELVMVKLPLLLFFIFFALHFFKFYFIFKLYITVLVLPNIKMNPPQVYMCSPPAFSRTHMTSCSCSPTRNSLHSNRWAQFSFFGSSSLPWVKVFWRN